MSELQLPPAFLQRVQEQLGPEYQAFIDAMSAPAVISLRTNPLKTHPSAEDYVPWHPLAYFLDERPSFVADPLFHAGAYYVQEASSMLLYQMVDWTQDMHILDLCAAPGGKSTLIAGAMSENSVLLANEVIPSRAGVLAENLTRWGHPNVLVSQNEPKAFRDCKDLFDLVVVDAPCSGEGMFRKDPRAIGEWSPEAVTHCAVRQRDILADVVDCVKPGGTLIYSTCTWSQEENEEVIEWLLDEYGEEFEIDAKSMEAAWGAKGVEIRGISHAAYRCWPHHIRGEGLFLCRLRRKGMASSEIEREPAPRRHRKKGKQPQPSVPHWQPWVDAFLHDPKALIFSEKNDKVYGYSKPLSKFLQRLPNTLRLIKKGVYLGKLFRKGINPSQELAMSPSLKEDLPSMELTLEQAQAYLKKEDLPQGDKPRSGYLIARYRGVALGWLKGAGHRLKNHYPINWRIRKDL